MFINYLKYHINTYIKIKFKIIILIKLMIYPKMMENMTTKQIHFSNNSIDKTTNLR